MVSKVITRRSRKGTSSICIAAGAVVALSIAGMVREKGEKRKTPALQKKDNYKAAAAVSGRTFLRAAR